MRTDMRERDGRIFSDFFAANMEFVAALGESARERIGCPADDLISQWLHGRSGSFTPCWNTMVWGGVVAATVTFTVAAAVTPCPSLIV